jgi:hypothetical protein
MDVREVIRAEKAIISQGIWNVGVKMPKSVFPLGKSNSFKVTAKYHWRLVTSFAMRFAAHLS